MTGPDSSTVRTTVAQLDPVLGDVDANRAAVESTLSRARSQDSDLVVFPELFLTGYHIGDEPDRLTEDAIRAVEELRALTDDLVVVLGTPTRGASGERYNSAVVLQNGEIVGTYHKTHLYGGEPELFRPGDRFPTIETAVGTLGVDICYDVEVPEVARRLAMNGADILVTISANMRPCVRDQALYHGARAIENGLHTSSVTASERNAASTSSGTAGSWTTAVDAFCLSARTARRRRPPPSIQTRTGPTRTTTWVTGGRTSTTCNAGRNQRRAPIPGGFLTPLTTPGVRSSGGSLR
jgi:predicted amidohydrolase